MNERIKQLWAQAGGNYDGGNQHTWPQYTIDDPAKFAELIVKECSDFLKDTLDDHFAAEQLEEHFGVEE
jgi:hypothetical protein